MGTIYVSNTKRNERATLYSHDGDSVHIHPGAVDMPVDSKFSWKLPFFITTKTAPVISTNQEVEHTSNLEEALKRAKEKRQEKEKMAASQAPKLVGRASHLSGNQIARASDKVVMKVNNSRVGNGGATNPLQSRKTTARITTGPAKHQ